MKLFRLMAAVAFVCLPAFCQSKVLGPYSTTFNFSVDIFGTPGTAWGNSGSSQSISQFHPPAGYRTRILGITSGDFIARPKSGVIAPGEYAEVGFGLKSSAADGSQFVTFPGYPGGPYDNSVIWVQGLIDSATPSIRIPLQASFTPGLLLEPDNLLIAQSFVALNSTGLSVHCEPTMTVVFEFDPQ